MAMAHSFFYWLALQFVVPSITVAEYTIFPTSQEVAIGEQATFRCQHNIAHILYWRFNGDTVGSSPPSGVARSTSEEGDNTVLILTVTGSQQYNGSTIVCVAAFLNGSFEESYPAYLTVLSMYFTPPPDDSGFLETPITMIVPIGIKAEFRCKHSTADGIGWRINGTSLSSFHPVNISTKGITTNSGFSHALIINAIPAYNETLIECVAIFFDGSAPIISPIVSLIIQGPLGPVSNITVKNSTSISLSWQPPFTLNLSGVEPNIVYCIEVFRITCANDGVQVFSKCDITELYFHYRLNNSDPRNEYSFIITPTSNIAGAISGMASEPVAGRFTANVNVETRLNQFEPLAVQVIVNAHTWSIVPSCLSGQYIVSLWSIDNSAGLEELENLNCSTAITATYGATVKLSLNCKLDVRRLCQCHLFYHNLMPQGNVMNVSLANNFELSTHDVQNITILTVRDQIHLNYNYASGSYAKGLLTIAHSKENFYCVVVERGNGQRPMIIDNLNAGTYYVAVFVVDQQGIPLNRSASLPSIATVHVQGNSTAETEMCQAKLGIEASISKNSNYPLNRSIHCIFHDEDSSGCVVLIHPVVHNTSEILSVKVHFISRDSDTASINVTLDNINDHVTVFSYSKTKKMIYGHPINLTSGMECMDMNDRHLYILAGVVTSIISSTCIICLILSVLIPIHSVKRVSGQVKSPNNSGMRLENYLSASSETSTISQEISLTNSDCDKQDPETPTLCVDDIQDFEHSQVSCDDPLRSILLSNLDTTSQQYTLNSDSEVFVYTNENNCYSTLDILPLSACQVQIFNTSESVEEGSLLQETTFSSQQDPLNMLKEVSQMTNSSMQRRYHKHSSELLPNICFQLAS